MRLEFILFPLALAVSCASGRVTTVHEPDDIVAGEPGGMIVVRVTGLESGDGGVRVALYDGPEGFATSGGFLQGRLVPAGDKVNGVVEVVFEGVSQGDYAVSAFQDVNDNGILDQGAFGIPDEPYGFSRGARGRFGAPEFTDASFRHGLAEQLIYVEF